MTNEGRTDSEVNGVGRGQRLQPRGDSAPLAKDVAILLHEVASVNPDADMNLPRSFLVRIVST